MFGLLLGTMVCTTTLVSQSLGSRRHRDCSAYAWVFATLFVIVIGITFYIRWHRGSWEKLDVIDRNAEESAEFGSAVRIA
jgi:Na+-driven multidrug efflux pump